MKQILTFLAALVAAALPTSIIALDASLTWSHDEVGPPQSFNVERKHTNVPSPSWGTLGTTPGDGSGSYSYLDPSIPAGVYRYRVNAQNPAGVSAWIETKQIADTIPGNLAPSATATASSSYPQGPSDYLPSNATDETFGDFGADTPLTQWAPNGDVGEWIQLDWATPVAISEVHLSDRSNIRQITDCTLTFSDTSSVSCGGPLPDNGDPLVLVFPTKTGITWVRMTIDASTVFPGLDEIIVIGSVFVTPSAPSNLILSSTP